MEIRVIRAFLHKGERQEVGSVIEVHDGLAAELIHGNRAERAGDAPAASPGPMTTDAAPQLVSGAKSPKGKQND